MENKIGKVTITDKPYIANNSRVVSHGGFPVEIESYLIMVTARTPNGSIANFVVTNTSTKEAMVATFAKACNEFKVGESYDVTEINGAMCIRANDIMPDIRISADLFG
jgi:hypothetical protein